MSKNQIVFIFLYIFFCFSFSEYTLAGPDISIKSSVVKIYSIYADYNYYQPWQKRAQGESSGSGCIIEGKRILTNAHVVSNSTFMQIKRSDQSKKYNARVRVVAHECDLAVLTVDDETFFQGSRPIPVSDLPNVRDRVSVYGFPIGGEELSITEGVISRIENVTYAHSSMKLLSCQIDAAINSGNSGGPVIKDGAIVGVAFQAIESGENIGYIIAAPIINHFLQDIEDGRYDGFPDLGLTVQNMENPSIRKYYGMDKNTTGVLVNNINFFSPAQKILAVGDIILSIDSKPIANDGTVEFRKGERTSYLFAVQNRNINDYLPIVFFRKGEIKKRFIKLTKNARSMRLVPFEQYDKEPVFYITGGMVFEPLSKNYLMEWGARWYDKAPTLLLNYYFNGKKSMNRNEIVVLVKVLADEINAGYHDLSNLVIIRINEKKISNMKDVVEAIEKNNKKYHVIESEDGTKIILSRTNAQKYSSRILQRYQILHDRSMDLKKQFMMP